MPDAEAPMLTPSADAPCPPSGFSPMLIYSRAAATIDEFRSFRRDAVFVFRDARLPPPETARSERLPGAAVIARRKRRVKQADYCLAVTPLISAAPAMRLLLIDLLMAAFTSLPFSFSFTPMLRFLKALLRHADISAIDIDARRFRHDARRRQADGADATPDAFALRHAIAARIASISFRHYSIRLFFFFFFLRHEHSFQLMAPPLFRHFRHFPRRLRRFRFQAADAGASPPSSPPLSKPHDGFTPLRMPFIAAAFFFFFSPFRIIIYAFRLYLCFLRFHYSNIIGFHSAIAYFAIDIRLRH
jgi:hypothetical protein